MLTFTRCLVSSLYEAEDEWAILRSSVFWCEVFRIWRYYRHGFYPRMSFASLTLGRTNIVTVTCTSR